MTLKKITFLLVFILLCVSCSSAYLIEITGPETINAGEILVVNGTSNLPPGVTAKIWLSERGSFTILTERQVTIQQGGIFNISYETDTLKKGSYYLEVQKMKDYPFGSDSKVSFIFNVIDRRDELVLLAPLAQSFDGSLTLRGKIPIIKDSGLKVLVENSNGIVFGPEYIKTSSDGEFELEVPIDKDGLYTVTFTDNTGYNWISKYNAISQVTTLTPTQGVTTSSLIQSETLPSSRNDPAYFKVVPGQGIIRAYTSEGIDWVMEYTDDRGVKKKVNIRGTSAEEVSLPVSVGTLYFKIYPDRYEDRAMVTLYVENARAIEPCPTCAGLFEAETTPTEEIPLPFFIAIIAILLSIALRKSQ